ncbi:MAG: ATP-binding cassette domain-containing protein [Desulfovibrio sp.]|jgi:NitT/TauT family transport system ATP-binding protein|nr:ATP-binding cassette domain-containing protein [Desulfovibrio sp.]
MLEIADIRKAFNGRTVIASASLSLEAGEVLCLTGPSGVGKTTLLEIIAGILRPDGGRIKKSAPVALMFQDNALIPWLTAEETVDYILPDSVPRGERRERVTFWLDRFGLEGGIHPAAMSGGMRRRLSLARTFAARRPLILLDEPFAFLDAAWCGVVCEEIAAHAGSGCGIILAAHTTEALNAREFSRVACRTLIIRSSPVSIDPVIFE